MRGSGEPDRPDLQRPDGPPPPEGEPLPNRPPPTRKD
jgi:hypothetical protein